MDDYAALTLLVFYFNVIFFKFQYKLFQTYKNMKKSTSNFNTNWHFPIMVSSVRPFLFYICLLVYIKTNSRHRVIFLSFLL